MRTHTTTAILIAAGLLLTGCGNNINDDTRNAATPDKTVTATTETPDTKDQPGDKALGLTDTATYEDGIEVSLSGFTRGTSSNYAYPENAPYVKFAAKVTNGTKKTLDMNEMYLQCQYGDQGKEGEQIFDSENGLDGSPSTHLRPGRSITTLIACELPKGEKYVQVEVTPDFDSETAIFAGDVK
jgi:hypothetical protein